MLSSQNILVLGMFLALFSSGMLAVGTILTNGQEPIIGISCSFLTAAGLLMIMLWELDERPIVSKVRRTRVRRQKIVKK